jgi:hypothetical protein
MAARDFIIGDREIIAGSVDRMRKPETLDGRRRRKLHFAEKTLGRRAALLEGQERFNIKTL